MSEGDDFRRAVLRVKAVFSGTWRLHLDCGHTRIVSGKKRPGFERITCTACVRGAPHERAFAAEVGQ